MSRTCEHEDVFFFGRSNLVRQGSFRFTAEFLNSIATDFGSHILV